MLSPLEGRQALWPLWSIAPVLVVVSALAAAAQLVETLRGVLRVGMPWSHD